MKEKYIRLLVEPSLALTGLFIISFFGFSRQQKEQAIAERGNRCQKCGKTNIPLYAHHILPEQMGGADNMDNLFLACNACHQELDSFAIKKGHLANGLDIRDVKSDLPEIIGDPDKFEKALRRFKKVKKIKN
jgi:hypothetical protein